MLGIHVRQEGQQYLRRALAELTDTPIANPCPCRCKVPAWHALGDNAVTPHLLSTPGPTTSTGRCAFLSASRKSPPAASLAMAAASLPRCVYLYVRSTASPIRPTCVR
jgi:hypothetical protein